MARKHHTEPTEPVESSVESIEATTTEFTPESIEEPTVAESVIAESVETVETLEAVSSPAGETTYERTEFTETTALERTAEPAEDFSEAIREGASDARDAAAGFIPAVGGMIHKGIYNGFYFATYGVVFGSMVVGNLIPSNNAMGEGVRDGFKAARRAFDGRERVAAEEAAAAETAMAMEEGLAAV
ncbi:hypothetical protein [Methylomagnum sp.]